MKLAATVVIVAIALGGCGSEPIWKSTDAPQRKGEEVAPAGPAAASPPADEVEQPQETREAAPKPQPAPGRKRSPQLLAGIAAYDDGRYAEAAKALRSALASKLDKSDEVSAHKYLAFIECSTRRRTQCREEFRKALRIDPSFDLEPAEAGHPVWGPIFRGLKQKPKR